MRGLVLRICFLVILLGVSLISAGWAEEAKPLAINPSTLRPEGQSMLRVDTEPSRSIKIGADMRLRSETLVNFDSFVAGRTPTADDSFILLRLRPYVEASPMRQIRFFVQPQFSRNFAQEESTLANGRTIDDFDLHQGYIEFTQLAQDRFSVRIGRQELNYGDERLIGALDWSNTGRNFDAGKLTYTFDHGWVDGFASWIERAAGNRYFGGLYGHWDIGTAIDDEPYALVLRDNDGGTGGADLTVYTIGNRVSGTVSKTWDYGAEVALQLGQSGNSDILAYAAHVHAGYTTAHSWKPRIGLEYSVASGDGSPGSGKTTTFNNLFPTNHNKYGYMDLIGWRNIHNPAVSFQASPVANLSLGLAGHAFLLMESADGLYQASGTQVRVGSAAASRYVGSEIDTTLSYKWTQYARFLVGYSFFKAGAFLGDTGISQDAHFVYAQTQVRFDTPLK